MTLQALTEIMAPPPDPVETGDDEEWSSIEESIGTPLPNDYKEYIASYGTGSIAEFLWTYNPFASNPNLNLMRRMNLDLGALRQIEEEFGEEECPYPLYPEKGGLLPWGITDNGDVVYWLTRGNPDEWTIVLNESRGPEFEEFHLSATGFLAGLISGQLPSDILPPDAFQGEIRFQPISRG